MNKKILNKRNILYFIIMILSLYFLATIVYFIQLSKVDAVYLNNVSTIVDNYFLRSIGNVNIDFGLEVYIPNWDSFWNDLSMKVYTLIGYDTSLILDLLQAAILFLTGMSFVQDLIFRSSNPNKPMLNDFFFKIYLIAFVVMVVLFVYNIYKSKKDDQVISESGKGKKFISSLVLVAGTVLFVPAIIILFDTTLILMLRIFFPLVANVLFDVDIYDDNSLLGEYTLSTIIFNSSFKEQMGSYIYVPSPEALFPGETYTLSYSMKLTDFDFVLFSGEWSYTVGGKNQQVVDSINFFLLYLGQMVIMVLLTLVCIKIAKNTFKLLALVITSPLYMSTSVNDGDGKVIWVKSIGETLISISLIIVSYLIFSLSIPSLFMAISYEEIDTFRDVNWIGIVNIITIISGLYFTLKIEKILINKKQKNQKIEVNSKRNEIESESENPTLINGGIFEVRRNYV